MARSGAAADQRLRRRVRAAPAGPQRRARAAADLDRAAPRRVRPDDRAPGADGRPAAGGQPGVGEQQHRQPAPARHDGLARVRRDAERRRADAARRPGGVYAQMDFDTRDRYRHVGRGASAGSSDAAEVDVARQAVALCAAASAAERRARAAPDGRRCHVGFYLVGAGRPALEQAVGARLPPRAAARARGAARARCRSTRAPSAWAPWRCAAGPRARTRSRTCCGPGGA